jgi:OCT family organic cation transporter-like MFS transporter 4/5
MVMELFGPTYRTMAGCIIEAFWAFGLMIIAVLTMYIQNWRYIQLAINVPTLSTIIFIWIIPESLRWLISRGKYNRASVVVKTVIKW